MPHARLPTVKLPRYLSTYIFYIYLTYLLSLPPNSSLTSLPYPLTAKQASPCLGIDRSLGPLLPACLREARNRH